MTKLLPVFQVCLALLSPFFLPVIRDLSTHRTHCKNSKSRCLYARTPPHTAACSVVHLVAHRVTQAERTDRKRQGRAQSHKHAKQPKPAE